MQVESLKTFCDLVETQSFTRAADVNDVSQSAVSQTVAAMEQALIIDTLEHCLGNRTHAANILGISIRTLRNKLREYGDAGHAVPPPAGDKAA